ncbi:hypothetical protein F2Q70_00000470 [Brassica cretica]|uniref:Uncharacterized protein n=1 Tax=Brassica cretica TaxID=69181 RepID=A0A8S9INU2_BRACR|nr:hypothetical protein F2Q70_00000470 [Brassica cretica]
MIQDQPLVVFSLRRNSFRRRSSITNLDDRGWTPLHVKARKGDLKSVKQLLDQGFDVNALAWGPKSKGKILGGSKRTMSQSYLEMVPL